jgi:acetyl esterase/lipase
MRRASCGQPPFRSSPDLPGPPTTAADTTLRYGPHPDQVADLRLPPQRHPRPLVLVLHGGFWRQRYDRAHAGAQSEALAAAGYAVATIEYRRVGGDGGVPATFDDAEAAVDAVPALAAEAAPGRVDPAHVVLVGHSAGGHLALWASCRSALPNSSRWHRPTPPSLSGVVSLAGVCDLAAAVRDRLGNGAASDLLACSAGPEIDHLDPALFPQTGVPTVLVHGVDDADVPPRYSVHHADRLRASGTPVELRLLPSTGHFELIDPASSAWSVVLESIGHALGGLTTLRDRAP